MNQRFPPGPPNDAFGWNHIAPMRQDLIGFCGRLQREYGDVAYFRLGPFPCYQFTHPDQIHELLVRKAKCFHKPARLKQVFGRFEGNGLVVSDGELWLRQHRVVTPAFSALRLESYAAVIARCVDVMLDDWNGNAVVDVSYEMRRLTLRIVTETLFSRTLDDDSEQIGDAINSIQRWSMVELNRVFATPKWMPLIGQPNVRQAIAFIDRLVWRIIRERRESKQRANDLLGWLLDAADSEDNRQRMSDRQVRDEVVTLLLAGHETSAAALTWTAWLLAKHVEIQNRIAVEVQTVLRGRTPAFSDLPNLVAVEQTLKESMRLYPPVYFLSRQVVETVEIGGYELQPTSQVYLNPYLTHRDPRWFPQPERFDPLRFNQENEHHLPPCAWFPFGAGPRACIGSRFAMMEGTLVLATLLQRFRLELAPGQVDPELEWQLSLHPKCGIRLAVHPLLQSDNGAYG